MKIQEYFYKKPFVKICGNLYLEESLKVAKYFPDFMGWIFSPYSPRKISIKEAKAYIKIIKKEFPQIFHVGVFAGNTIEEILNIIEILNESDPLLSFLQIPEEDEIIPLLRKKLFERKTNILIIPVLRPKEKIKNELFFTTEPSDFWILDRYDPIQKGGSGKEIPNEFFQEKIDYPFLIAGGVNPENVIFKLQSTKAIGIDVSSGVEISPGIKSEEKLQKLFQKIQSFTFS